MGHLSGRWTHGMRLAPSKLLGMCKCFFDGKGSRTMHHQVEETSRDAILVEDAHIRPMMGFEILEPLPSRSVPYGQVDPFILVHEARFQLSKLQDVDTKHRTVGSTTCGTSWMGRPAPATARDPRERSNAHSCPRARCWRSGPGRAPGTPRGSARSSARKDSATRSGAACSSG